MFVGNTVSQSSSFDTINKMTRQLVRSLGGIKHAHVPGGCAGLIGTVAQHRYIYTVYSAQAWNDALRNKHLSYA